MEKLALAAEFRDDQTDSTPGADKFPPYLPKALYFTGDQVELIRYAAPLGYRWRRSQSPMPSFSNRASWTAYLFNTMATHTTTSR